MSKPESTYNNDMSVDYDKSGFCALCHVAIAVFDGFSVDQTPNLLRWLGIATKTRVILDDGSKMDISMCIKCDENLLPKDCGPLMESVIRGWHWEVLNKLTKWTQEQKDAYMARYSKRYIMNRDHQPWSADDLKEMKKPRPSRMDVRK
jgi:hypothetical protein